MRRSGLMWFGGLIACVAVCGAQPANVKVDAGMDRDLMEISVLGLEKLYAQHRYTVTQVTRWYLDRIAKYDGTYRALLYVDAEGAFRGGGAARCGGGRTAAGGGGGSAGADEYAGLCGERYEHQHGGWAHGRCLRCAL